MKLRKIFAAFTAMAVAATMAISASAEITNANGEGGDAGRYILDLGAEGYDYSSICKVEVTIEGELTVEVDGEMQELYGAIIFQDEGNTWNQALEFGADKEVQIGDGVLVYESATPIFTEGATWAKVVVADWGAPNVVSVASVKVFDAEGNEVLPAADEPVEDEPTEDEPTEGEPSEDEPVEEPTEDEPTEDEPAEDDAPATGFVAMSVAGLAVAGAAVIASKKRK